MTDRVNQVFIQIVLDHRALIDLGDLLSAKKYGTAYSFFSKTNFVALVFLAIQLHGDRIVSLEESGFCMDDGNLAYRAVVLTDSKRVSQNIFRVDAAHVRPCVSSWHVLQQELGIIQPDAITLP